MIRLVVVTSDCGAVASGAPGAVPENYAQTFDIEHPQLEAALKIRPQSYITKMLTYELCGETK